MSIQRVHWYEAKCDEPGCEFTGVPWESDNEAEGELGVHMALFHGRESQELTEAECGSVSVATSRSAPLPIPIILPVCAK